MARIKPRAPDPPTPSWLKTVDAQKVIDDLKAKKFVSPRAQIAFLPYYEEISESIDERFENLQHGLLTSCLLLQQKMIYEYALNHHIDTFGLRFTRERQLQLVKLVFLILTKEGQHKEVIKSAAELFVNVIDGSLNHKDLQLDWKPFYQMYTKTSSGLDQVARSLKRFYDPEEIKKIWEKLQEHNTPGNEKKFHDLCFRFLPDHLNAEQQKKYGAVFWWVALWQSYKNLDESSKKCEDSSLPDLFSSVMDNAPDFMDWSPLYEEVLRRLLLSVRFTLRRGDGNVEDTLEVPQGPNYPKWGILWTFSGMVAQIIFLGGPRSIQPELNRILHAMERCLQASPENHTKEYALKVMKKIAEEVKDRFDSERSGQNSSTSQKYCLKYEDREMFVTSMLPMAMSMMFDEKRVDRLCNAWSTNRICDSCEFVRVLAFLSPDIVLPEFFKRIQKISDVEKNARQLKHVFTCIIGISEDFETMEDKEYHQKIWNSHATKIRRKLVELLEQLLKPSGKDDGFETVKNARNAAAIYRLNWELNWELKEKFGNSSDSYLELARRTMEKTLNTVPSVLLNSKKRDEEWEARKARRNDTELTESEIDEEEEESETTAGEADDVSEDDDPNGSDNSEEDKSNTESQTDESDVVEQESAQARSEEDSARYESDGEHFTKRLVRSISTLLEFSTKEFKEALVNMIYDFFASKDLEQYSHSSTDTCKKILMQVVSSCPHAFSRFAKFFIKKLEIHVAPKIRRKREVDNTGKWYLSMTEGLFSTSSEVLMENKDLCFKIFSILFKDYKYQCAYQAGAESLLSALFILTRTYVLSAEGRGKYKRRCLDTWNDHLGWPHGFLEVHGVEKIYWHVPDESCRLLAEELIHRFVFPFFEVLRDKDIEDPHLVTFLWVTMYMVRSAHHCFAPPEAQRDSPVDVETIPSPKCFPIRIPKPNLAVVHPSGKSVYEMIVDFCERLIDQLDAKEFEDLSARNWNKYDKERRIVEFIVCLLRDVFTQKQIDFGMEFGISNKRAREVFKFNILHPDAMVGGQGYRHNYYSALHFVTVARQPSQRCNPLQMRAIGLFFRLGFHQSWVVRDLAGTPLWEIPTMMVPEYRMDVTMKTVEILEYGVTEDQLTWMSMTIQMIHRWAEWENDDYRRIIWKALARVTILDLPGNAKLLGDFVKCVKTYSLLRWGQLSGGECEDYAYGLWRETKKKVPWTSFSTDSELNEAKKTAQDELRMADDELKSMLVEMEKTKRRKLLVAAMLEKIESSTDIEESSDGSSDVSRPCSSDSSDSS